MGLVTHCVPDAELDAFVEQYMEKLLAAPQQAMRLTKRAVVQGTAKMLEAETLDMNRYREQKDKLDWKTINGGAS